MKSSNDIAQVVEIARINKLEQWSAQDYKDEITRKDSLTYVATYNSKVIGFAVARLIIIQKCDSNLSADLSEIELYNIGVNPSYQRRRVGQRLLENIFSQINSKFIENFSIYLEVRSSNLEAINFYKKNHFKIISIRKNFFAHPNEDGIVMNLERRKNLKL